MYRLALVFITMVLLFGCNNNNISKTKNYVIVDQPSNKVISEYEYDEADNTLKRTISYGNDENVKKIISYEYDNKGYLSKTIESVPNKEQKEITYSMEEVKDAAGRLVKTIQTSSDGKKIETYYGYDKEGNLRGVVEQVNNKSVMMKDYPHE
ncbi:MAG: hypothetical protein DRP57_09565 [Spirochaetes bacterium]|nr:MAG: hypothetical protein DRP57_09565 [Spirochaetota bacterium]